MYIKNIRRNPLFPKVIYNHMTISANVSNQLTNILGFTSSPSLHSLVVQICTRQHRCSFVTCFYKMVPLRKKRKRKFKYLLCKGIWFPLSETEEPEPDVTINYQESSLRSHSLEDYGPGTLQAIKAVTI